MMRLILLVFSFHFLTACNHIYYQPNKIIYFNPSLRGYDYEEMSLKSKDETDLSAWWIKTKTDTTKIKAKTTLIVQLHGNAQNITDHVFYLLWLADEGYDLLTFDYRGYGQSKGKANRDGVHEDIKSLLKMLNEKFS